MSIDAMKQALEALETYHGYMEPLLTVFGGPRVPAEQSTTSKVEKSIIALRLAIEQAELDELEERCGGPINHGWQLIVSDGHSNRGVYAYMPEHPEEAVFLMPIEQAERQEPVACSVCKEVHAILDADESQIIRNAEDGYPDGRKPRILTLQERVNALCVYASDWKRWCLEKENAAPPQQEKQKPVAWANINKHGDITHTSNKRMPWANTPLYTAPPQRQPLTDEEIKAVIRAGEYDSMEEFARAIERAHGIGGEHD